MHKLNLTLATRWMAMQFPQNAAAQRQSLIGSTAHISTMGFGNQTAPHTHQTVPQTTHQSIFMSNNSKELIFHSGRSYSTYDKTAPLWQIMKSKKGANANNKLQIYRQVSENLRNQRRQVDEQERRALDTLRRQLKNNENLKSRIERQIDDAKMISIRNFSKDIIQVADSLSMAISTVPVDKIHDPTVKSLHDGLRIIESLLHQIFQRHGLKQVNPLKEKFDPRFHEALFKRKIYGTEPNTVVEVSRIGYKLNERCIRPALVGVAS